ncbi:MAG TPA: hypothetical protein DCS93_21095 [Microscillaceae bacterium]|nr:hypothetical protein [Microscillaceae bacterium]
MKEINKSLYYFYYKSGNIAFLLCVVSLLLYLSSLIFFAVISNILLVFFSFSLGIFLGWIYYKKTYSVITSSQSKKSKPYYNKYKNGETMRGLINSLRSIIFVYGGRSSTKSFIFNIFNNKKLIIQLLHRAHFPELCESVTDISFGIAIYIPVDYLNNATRNLLEKVMLEEGQDLKQDELPNTYYVVDIGGRLMYGSYLLSRIIKEVFGVEDNALFYELHDDLNLPYDKQLLTKYQKLN